MPSEDVNDQPVDDAVDLAQQDHAASQAAPGDGLSAVTPDVVEQELADQMDNVVPTRGYHLVPTVGLGGSAGGIQALTAFFQAMPPDPGLVFVVVLHLSPEHDSTLAELLARHTAMRVQQAEDGMKVEPNNVYVIPPAKHLTMTDGHLRLTDLEAAPGKRVAVDLFFRSLADTHGPHATAVVLSGVDSDGSIGLRRVKERGGLTIAQDPAEAEQDGMPRSAIATGMVDWVLRVADMPARIQRYYASEDQLRLPPEDGPQPAKPAAPPPNEDEAALRETLLFLRTRTGSDFSYYKRATILRRIARRMQINEVRTLPSYLAFVRTHPGESGALLQDLLISVTNFFRDREAFAAVEERIPALFEGKGPNDTVRVWSAACATGEETYSLAMLLNEHARTLDYPPQVQVFGCDLDETAIQTARAGMYPPTIAADVSETRLDRFFLKTPHGYQVRRELRETVLFAQHDLLKDAPFSRMDLISCRNLLIYLDREAQARALEIFHFALNPEGLLFLGNAETVSEEPSLFSVVDKKYCLFRRRATMQATLPVPSGTGTLLRALQAQAKEAPVVPRPTFPAGAPLPTPSSRLLLPALENRVNLTDLHFQLLERYAPPSLVIDEGGEIVHLSESVGRFLRPPGGQLTANFLQMVLPGLRMELRAALLRLEDTKTLVEVFGVPAELDGAPQMVDLRLAPADELAPGYVLVSFAARQPDASAAPGGLVAIPPDVEAVVRHLERELETTRAQFSDTLERARASEEEYKSSNEELQSMNEELRSASEELETSREELQSLNEELTTVNSELKGKVEEIGHSNSDLHNLINATDIATVFLDRDLRVVRFTPEAVPLFNLIPSDVGRQLRQLWRTLDYSDLEADARQVLRSLQPTEREVNGPDGETFLARLLPYRSLDDHIEGLVLTCVNITQSRAAETARRETETMFRAFMAATNDTVYRMSADWSEMRQLEGKNFLADTQEPNPTWLQMYIPAEDQPEVLARIREAIREKRPFELEHRVVRADGAVGWTFSRAIPRFDDRGEIREWIGAASDVTERHQVRDTLRANEEKYRTLFEAIDQGFYVAEAIYDRDGKCTDIFYHDENPAAVRLMGQSAKGRYMSELGPYEQYWRDLFGHTARTGEARRLEHYAAPNDKWYDFYVFRPPGTRENGFAVIFRDVTERHRTDEPLRADTERLRLAVDAAQLGTCDWNYLTGEMRWNDRRFRLYGLEPRDGGRVRVEDFYAAVHPQDRARIERAAREGLEGPTGMVAEEYRVVWPDGSVHWITETGRVVERLPNGAPSRVVKVLQDFSARRSSEIALRASEEKYRTLFESLDEGFCVAQVFFDDAGQANDIRFLETNPAFERQSGLRRAEGQRASEIVPGLEPYWFEAYGRVARTGQPERFENYAAPLGRWFNVYAWRYGAPGSRQVAILFQDETERRQAAERVRASEEGYRLIFESARAIAIFTLDAQENITSWNPAAASLFGRSAAEAVGQSVYELMPADQQELGAFRRQTEIAVRAGRYDCEEWFVRRDGSRFWGSGVLSPLLSNGEVTGFLKILRDATDELQAQEAREFVARERARLLEVEQAARQTAEEANVAKDQFLAVLSHELRTPLTPITMALAVLEKRTDVPAPVRSTLHMIQRNVSLESHLIDDLLDVTRIARGKMELVRTDMDLHEAVRRAVEISAPDSESKGQRLTVEMPEEECRLNGDPARLQQVFWNLLKNASKFTPEGGAVGIYVRDREGGKAVVEVTDTGIGLEAGAAERIFHPFEQASVSITRQFGGLGLGLAIAKATVEAHGGTLRASSPGPGQGATFTVRLPLAVAGAEDGRNVG
ncbi:MAG: PAS domain S-box protein [Gluconacetobacter diazotrophicus]|nr:PAS domain S-box protein [Gluconacetobacter diazotrophicus]